MDASPLSRLPAEIRNIIYKLALQSSSTLKLAYSCIRDSAFRAELPLLDFDNRRNITALTRTCRAIRAESTQLFYSINTFQISIPVFASPTNLRRALKGFFAGIAPHHISAMRSIVVDLGTGYTPGGCQRFGVPLAALRAQQTKYPHCNFTVRLTCGVRTSSHRKSIKLAVEVPMQAYPGNWAEIVEDVVARSSKAGQMTPILAHELLGLRNVLKECGPT
jgi:hypothetical protein